MKKAIVILLLTGIAVSSALLPSGTYQASIIALVVLAVMSAVALPLLALAWGIMYRTYLKPIEARLGGHGLQIFKLFFTMPSK